MPAIVITKVLRGVSLQAGDEAAIIAGPHHLSAIFRSVPWVVALPDAGSVAVDDVHSYRLGACSSIPGKVTAKSLGTFAPR